MEFLQQEKVRLIAQSLKSPDANPIEIIWAQLKREVERQRPEDKDILCEAIENSWERLVMNLL